MTTRSTAPISVIVPTYNRARYLRDSVPSLLRQTISPAEIVVVDDGSTDDTPAVVASFGPAVRSLRKENGGKAAALNLALPLVTQPYVWIFDDDDMAEPNALDILLGALESDATAGFAWGGFRHFYDEPDGSRLYRAPFPVPHVPREDLYPALMARCFILQPGLLVRRAAYDAVGRFDERYFRSQDYEMLLRLARRFEGVDTHRVVYAQRVHNGARGPAGHEVAASAVTQAWQRYDAMTFRAIHASHGLREYLPRNAPILDDAGEALALLRRMTIMGRKGLWDLAAGDLTAFAAVARRAERTRLTSGEAAFLRTILDGWSYGHAGLAGPEGAAFLATLAGLGDPALAGAIRRAIIQPLPYILRTGLADPSHHAPRIAWTLLRALARPADLAGLVLRKTLGRLRMSSPAPGEDTGW